MTEYQLDNNGKVIAFIEWNLLDKYGHFDDKGEQVWVQEIYIAPQYRNNGILKGFIRLIAKKAPTAEYCRFRRRITDNETTNIKQFSRNIMIRRI